MTRPTPEVSWLICTHICDDRLFESLESCLNQTYQDFEVILVANGVNRHKIENKVYEWFPENSKIKIVKTNLNHLTFSLNLGIHECKGQLIARMDADDISDPDRLRKQVDFMNNNPKIAILGSFYKIIDISGKEIAKKILPTTNRSIRRSFIYTNPLCHPSIIIRRILLENEGGYMGGVFAEDYDLWLRLLSNKNILFANIPEYLLYYRNIGAGPARRSRQSYAGVCAAQIQKFVNTRSLLWLGASIITFLKSIIRSV